MTLKQANAIIGKWLREGQIWAAENPGPFISYVPSLPEINIDGDLTIEELEALTICAKRMKRLYDRRVS